MTSRQFYLERRRAELPVFVRVLRSLPADRLSYKPHERCPSAEQLAWTLTSELRACVEVAKEGRTEWRQEAPPPFERRSPKGEKEKMEIKWQPGRNPRAGFRELLLLGPYFCAGK